MTVPGPSSRVPSGASTTTVPSRMTLEARAVLPTLDQEEVAGDFAFDAYRPEELKIVGVHREEYPTFGRSGESRGAVHGSSAGQLSRSGPSLRGAGRPQRPSSSAL
jgi:hypothetical protein